eukprot:TRINITY_DN5611_c1_g1_i1.p1 TRINITY_DN5611_c1_g1~~TRINITY_DN5611_c1_g1_i1.p1  ORF type:complete len:1546 (+),score=470.16 TRINITY_DN5611_c1_g1_i1:127-4764(+)
MLLGRAAHGPRRGGGGGDPATRQVAFRDRITGETVELCSKFGNGLLVRVRTPGTGGRDMQTHVVHRMAYRPAEKVVRRTTAAVEQAHSLSCFTAVSSEAQVYHLPMQRGLKGGSLDDVMVGVYNLCMISGIPHDVPAPKPHAARQRTAGWQYQPRMVNHGDRDDRKPSALLPHPPEELSFDAGGGRATTLWNASDDASLMSPATLDVHSPLSLDESARPRSDISSRDSRAASRNASVARDSQAELPRDVPEGALTPAVPYLPQSPRGRAPLRVNVLSADTVESWNRTPGEERAPPALSPGLPPGRAVSPRSPGPPQAARGGVGSSPASNLRWVWEALQSRESRLGALSVSHSSAVQRVTTLEREVILANDRLVEQNALIERARLTGGLPDAGAGEDGNEWSAVVNSVKSNQGAADEGAESVGKPDAKASILRRPQAKKWAGAGAKKKPVVEVKASVLEGDVSEEKLAHFVRKMHNDEGEGVVQIGLDAMKKTVGAATMKREIKRWMTQQGGTEKAQTGDSNGTKYADGINDARAPDEIDKVDFYPDDYQPPAGVREIVDKISTWQSPIAYLWPEVTFTDMHQTMNLIEKHHSAGQHQNIVVPCYIYSISLFHRSVWVCKYSTKNAKFAWEVMTQQHEHLEKAYAAASAPGAGDADGLHYLTVEPRYFKDITGGAQLAPDGEMRRLPSHSDVYPLQIFRKDKLVFIRYDNAGRGSDISPLCDTILWLPTSPLKLEQDGYIFACKLDDLPPPGLIEYLTSRPTFEKLKWSTQWNVMQAIGDPAIQLIKQCLAAVDQQKVEPLLTDKYTKLQDNLERIHHKVKKKDASYQQGLEAIRLILKFRFPTNQASLYTPQAIAHALDIQKLSYNGKTYFINLCSPPFLVVELKPKMEPVEVQRLKYGFADQIFWHINACLRNSQFKRSCALHVRTSSKKDIDGRYSLLGDVPTYAEGQHDLSSYMDRFQFQRDAQPVRRAHSSTGQKKYWIFTGANGVQVTQAKQDQVGVDVGTWFTGQAQPICFYLDRALDLLRFIDGSKLETGVVAPPEGVKNYRGLSGVVLDRSVYDTNRIVLWGQFSSSSVDRGVASAFAKGSECAAVFTIIGRSCVRIAQWSRFAREHEWLYPPNSIFKITSCLSEEHQQILDKENLQLFSMEEVDEFEAIETHLRGVVPTIKGEDAPAHVMQLFTIIQFLTKRDTENCLNTLLNPTEQAMFTEQGVKLAHNLMKLIKTGVKACFEDPNGKEPAGKEPAAGTVTPPVNPEEVIKQNQRRAQTVVDRNFLQAAELGSEEALDLLLALGAGLESTGTGALTALQRSAINGHHSVVRRLVHIGANQEANGGGFRTIELAALRRDHALTEMLRESCPPLADLVPHKLEEFQPRVKLPPMGVLKTAVEAAKLKWDRTRAKHSEQQAVVVLFDREKNLFWLRFDDESTDLYPASVLTKPEASTQMTIHRRKSVSMQHLLTEAGVGLDRSQEHGPGSRRQSLARPRVGRGSVGGSPSRRPSQPGRRPSRLPAQGSMPNLLTPDGGDDDLAASVGAGMKRTKRKKK